MQDQLSIALRAIATDNIAMGNKNYTPREYSKAFRARTKLLRESAQLSQSEMARELGVSPVTYPKYESRSLLPHHLVPRFLRITGGTYEYLFRGNTAKRGGTTRGAQVA